MNKYLFRKNKLTCNGFAFFWITLYVSVISLPQQMPLPIGLLLEWSGVMAHHQGHVKVIVVVQALQILVRARTKAGKKRAKWLNYCKHTVCVL